MYGAQQAAPHTSLYPHGICFLGEAMTDETLQEQAKAIGVSAAETDATAVSLEIVIRDGTASAQLRMSLILRAGRVPSPLSAKR